MLNFVELDERTTLSHQLDEGGGPVILIAKFTVDPSETDRMIKAWSEDASFFQTQPGFISAQIHRGIAGSGVFINYAVWESTELFKQAYNRPEVKNHLSAYPIGTSVSLHLVRKMAVPGICLD